MQSFKFKIYNDMNNIHEKWMQMRNNQFIQYKIQILNNHESPVGIKFNEFKLFGVKYN